jgi:hypothetical protein
MLRPRLGLQVTNLATADLAATRSARYMNAAEADARELASRPAVQAAVRNQDFGSLNVDLERWIVEHPDITVFIRDLNGITRVTGLPTRCGYPMACRSSTTAG